MMVWLRRRGVVLALAGAAILAVVDIAWLQTLHYRVALPDFYVYYLAAQIGSAHGWATMYDPSVFLPIVTDAVGKPLPYLNPPELAWIVQPLSWLPYALAAGLWAVLLLSALASTWYLAAPGTGIVKAAHAAAAMVLLPAFVSIFIGQVSLVIVAAVAISWWLLQRERPWLAGIALAALFLKPQAAFVVPPVLLLAGYWRVVLGWLAATAPLILLSLLAVGTSVFHDIQQSMAAVHNVPGPIQMSLERQLPSSMALAGVAFVLVASMVVAIRSRGTGPSIPVAAGLLASIAVSPYINFYDLSAPLLAGWLILRTNPPRWQERVTFAMYVPLYLAPLLPLLTLACLCGWLASLAWLPTHQSAVQSGRGAGREGREGGNAAA